MHAARDYRRKIMILTKEQLHDALVERHGADIQAKLDKACVGIAGLGGLGSNLAIFLARLGVGHLILVDFDVVDITNLNRQHYTMKDLGIPKTLALVEQLEAINPYLTYETYTERVVPSNVERLFSECDVVVEAFDKPDQKAMLLENLLTRLPDAAAVLENAPQAMDLLNETTFASNLYESILAQKNSTSYVHEYRQQIIIV